MCRDQRALHGSIAGLCGACLWAAAWWLAAMPAWGMYGLEESPEKSPDEPQALLAPVELLPVNPEFAPSAELAGPKLFGPPVKLAPELNTLMGPGAGQTARAIDRIKPANFKELTPGEATRDLVLETLGEPAAVSPRGDSACTTTSTSRSTATGTTTRATSSPSPATWSPSGSCGSRTPRRPITSRRSSASPTPRPSRSAPGRTTIPATASAR